jgi:hypothetical protein
MREVLDELKLGEQQRTRAAEVLESLREETRSAFASVDFRELGRDERQQRFAEAREKVEQATEKADLQIAKILNQQQTKRLDQLRLQREGLDALERPEVAKQLGLDEQQLTKIRNIREAQGPGRFGGPGPGGGDRGNFSERTRQRRENIDSDILAVLTDQQRAAWAEMQGEQFQFPRRGGFGGFGGRGGQDGPPGFGRRGGDRTERRRPPVKPRDQ